MPPSRTVLTLQAQVDAWLTTHLDLVAEHHVRAMTVKVAEVAPTPLQLDVELDDHSFFLVGTTYPDTPEELDVILAAVTRRAGAIRGIVPALAGVNLQQISDTELAQRIETYLVAHPEVRWQRQRDDVARFFHRTHVATTHLLPPGTRWLRLEEEEPGRVVHGLLCADADGETLCAIAAVFPGRQQVLAEGTTDYRLRIVAPATSHVALRPRLTQAIAGKPLATLDDVAPAVVALVTEIADYFGETSR